MPAKQPQDHQAKRRPYVFVDADGKKHTMPYAAEVVDPRKITGREYYEAMRKGPGEQTAFMFAVLDAASLPDELLNPLLDLPMDKTVELVGEWLSWGDGTKASPGESSGSSA